MFESTAWALLPPLLVIVLAVVTKEVYSSLLAGIFAGALLVAGFDPMKTLQVAVVDGISASAAALAGNILFLVLMGMLASILGKAGGIAAFGRWAETHITSRLGAQLSTFCLGLLLFIDDYFNCLTVGTTMRPITDGRRISRAKLAYLIDATAAPICIIAPVSTWSAAVSGVAESLGTGDAGLALFIQTIPYNFYSLLTIVFVFCMICMDADFGKMKAAEEKARLTGDLGASEAGEENVPSFGDAPKAVVGDLLFPLIALSVSCIFFMMYVGGFFGATPWCEAENAGDVAAAFGATDTVIALPCGASVAMLLTCLYFSLRRTIGFQEMANSLPQGLCAMAPGILLLVFAMALKSVTAKLGTAAYVQGLIVGVSSEIYVTLPAVLFLVSVFLSFATGTSYGTFGVMLPIAAAVFPADSALLIIGLSACLSGAVCGDHCSPISDTTVMASMGARVNHLEHVATQLPYAIPVAAVSFGMYLLAGFWQNWAVCLGVGSALLISFLFLISRRQNP